MGDGTVVDAIATERRGLVARLRDASPQDWATPSLCAGWTVHHVVAHLCTPFVVPAPRMAVQVVRSRGIGPAMDAVARRLAARDPEDLLDLLEAHAGSAFRPPGMPVATPLTDATVHSVDVRWALGDPRTDHGDPERLRPVLDFLHSPRAVAGFVPPGRLRGLRLHATDLDADWGRGEEVRGPALGLAAAVLGRSSAYDLLEGPGLDRWRAG